MPPLRTRARARPDHLHAHAEATPLTLTPDAAHHRAEMRAAFERDVADVLRRERHDLPNPEGIAALVTRHLAERGWI